MEIPGGWGESREALWNGKSSGVGGQTGKKPSVGGVWIFSGTTHWKFQRGGGVKGLEISGEGGGG